MVVFGRNEKEHKARLMEERLEKNVKLNRNKCEWTVNKLSF